MATDTRRRVKLYALNADRQWDDRGTGHVTSSYVDRVNGMQEVLQMVGDDCDLIMFYCTFHRGFVAGSR